MNITKFRVVNYKSIKDSGEVYIDPNIIAFIGQNNAGKSAILDALQCVFPSVKKSITKSDFHKGTHDNIEITLWFSNITNEYIEEKFFASTIDKLRSKVNQLIENKETPEKIEAAKKMLTEVRIQKLEEVKSSYKIDYESMCVKLVVTNTDKMATKYYLDESSRSEIKEADLKKLLPFLKVIPAIRDPKNESTAGANSYLKELIAMLDDEMITDVSLSNGNSVSYKELNQIIAAESEKRCTSISSSITEFYNEAIGVNDFNVIISSDVNISKGTTYFTKILDKSTGIESDILSCGTGYQSMIILSILEAYVTLSQKRTEYILLIEEPEVYLHPALQRKMIDTLLLISKDNQVIFSSHSPITIGKMTRPQIKLVKRENGEASINDILVSEVIQELGIRADDILVNRGIVFVEGQDDQAVVKHILDKVHKGASEEINVINTGSCENLKFFANAEVIINDKYDIPFLIIRDSDGMNPSERKGELLEEIIKNGRGLQQKQIEKISNAIFITKEYSLEGYYIDSMLLEGIEFVNETIDSVIKCYICQYDHYLKDAVNENGRKNLANWYQPKHLLENFEDKFKAGDNESRQKHKERYVKAWRAFEQCHDCESDLDHFFAGRDILNAYTHDRKCNKQEYLVELIAGYSVEELKKSKLCELIETLENFCYEIYKHN